MRAIIAARRKAPNANQQAPQAHGPPGRVAAGEDVAEAVAVDVATRDADAAGEADVVGHEVVHHRAVFAAESDDVRPAALVGPDDDVGETVAVEVGGGQVLAAGE